MYASFYNLVEAPFPVTPDPKYLFLSDSHKEALASIVYGIENRRGFVAITGEVGTGKTTILRAYLDAIEDNQFTIIYVFNPEVTFEELVVLVADELGMSTLNQSTSILVSAIHRALIKEYENNRTVVLIIDEAQNTPVSTLESIRMLSNIETKEDKLLQIVLVGQPELQKLLNRHELRQLNQRIAVKSTITPLSNAESYRYIAERLDAVALDDKPIFEEAAITRIIKFSRGIPRSINIACDTALINGFGHSARPITERIVKEAISPLAKADSFRVPFWKPVVGSLAAVLLIAFFFLTSSGTRNAPAKPDYQPGVALRDAKISSRVASESSLSDVTNVSSTSNPTSMDIATAIETSTISTMTLSPMIESLTSISISDSGVDPVIDETYEENATEPMLAAEWGPPDKKAGREKQPTRMTFDQQLRIEWDSNKLPDTGFPAVRSVQTGDMISLLCVEMYGFASNGLYTYLQASNPTLSNINNVAVGESITFPPLTPELQLIRTKKIERKIRIKSVPTGVLK